MAVFVTHLELQTGCDFYQEFYLTNPDLSPMDITNCSFHAALQKHPGAIDANSENSDRVTNKLTTNVVDATNGIYAVTFPAKDNNHLEEGKYVYQVMMLDPNGHFSPVADGLVFVQKGFGVIYDQENIIDGGQPDTLPSPNELIIDGGTPTTLGSGPNIDGGFVLGYI